MMLFLMYAVSFYSKKIGKTSLQTVNCNQLAPKTIQQQNYLNYLTNPAYSVVVGMGPAGTGKTLLACHTAIQQLKENHVDRIVVTRPSVCVDEDIGFLPGTILKKMDPFTRPIFDIFTDYYSYSDINNFIQNNIIEISTLGFMRGRTFKNAFIIADEMQNSSPSQMKMLLTRIGDNSRLVITGDLEQSDLGEKNGLRDFYSRIEGKTFSNIQWVRFSNIDIQRSPIVSTIVELYDDKSLDPHL
jgi:phosphate starvation-inducible PhoH-like protein